MANSRLSADPGITRLVEKQMRMWELSRSQRPDQTEHSRAGVEDFVAISRQAGVGGREFATALGDALGWPMFDKEILRVMAGTDATRRQIYRSMDERDLGWVEEAFRVIMQQEFVKNDYFHRLTKTILSLARKGHAVFLGRAADLVLPKEHGFRVRLVAPVEMRVQHFVDNHDLTVEAARYEIKRLEQERAEFVQNHFDVDVDEPTRHDLTINLGRFSVARAVELILSARNRRA